MSRARRALLGLMAAALMLALSAVPASARISFEWFVGGHLLKAGEVRTFETTAGPKPFDMHGDQDGVNILILFTSVVTHRGRLLVLPNGRGVGHVLQLFRGLVIHNPKKCTIAGGGISTQELELEIVEGQNGEPLIRFAPEKGTALATFEFANEGTEECLLKGVKEELTGSVLALPLPRDQEVLLRGASK